MLLQRKYPVGCKFNSVRFNNLFPKLNPATLDCLSPVGSHLVAACLLARPSTIALFICSIRILISLFPVRPEAISGDRWRKRLNLIKYGNSYGRSRNDRSINVRFMAVVIFATRRSSRRAKIYTAADERDKFGKFLPNKLRKHAPEFHQGRSP